MSLFCENCGAPYKGEIPPYVKFVRCEYCGCLIEVPRTKSPKTTKRLIVEETVVEPDKTFKIEEFASFLTKRGVKTFDPLSGIMKIGAQEAVIDESGGVTGPEPLKSRVEKWIHLFMEGS